MNAECERYEALASNEAAERSGADVQFAKAHLAQCAECRMLESVLAVMADETDDGQFGPDDADEAANRRLAEHVVRAARPMFENETTRWWPRVVALAAALVLIAGGAWVFTKQRAPRTHAPAQVAAASKPTPPPLEPKAIGPAPALVAIRSIAGRDADSFEHLVVAEKTRIQTREAMLGLQVADADAWVRASPGSDFAFTSLRSRNYELELRAGHLDVHVEHGAGIEFRVSTPHGLVKVVGTLFSVETKGAQTRVAVQTGSLEVEVAGRAFRVNEGGALALARGHLEPATAAELASLRESTAQEALVHAGAHALTVSSDREVRIDGVSFGKGPVIARLATGQHQVVRTDARGRTEQKMLSLTAPTNLRESSAAKRVSATAPPIASPIIESTAPTHQGDESPEHLLQLGEQAHRRKDWAAAAAAYVQVIARSEDPELAQVARVSLGQLQVDHLGQPQLGQATCASYVEKNPMGSLRAEAELCQIRAFAALKQTTHELEAIDAFLRRWPNDLNAPPLARRRQALVP